jgi:rhomboid protease GluP
MAGEGGRPPEAGTEPDLDPVVRDPALDRLHRHIGEALWNGIQRPRLTRVLVGLIVAIHGLAGLRMWMAHKTGIIGVFLAQRDLGTLEAMGAMKGLRVSGGEYWRLVSCILLHGDGTHILLNSIALFALGRLCEAVFGPLRLLFLFLFAGMSGSLLSWAGGNANSVGASGGIFGLMGAAIVFGFRYKAELPPGAGELFRQRLIPWVALNLFIGAVIPMIDNLGHVGGLVGGCLLALVLNNRVVPGAEGTRTGDWIMGSLSGLVLAIGILGVLGVLS